jgi:DNA-binding response OmpR family regulator
VAAQCHDQEGVADMSQLNGAHVLVIDDDDVLRDQVRRMIERAGGRVTEAGNGRDGIRQIFSSSVDVVILDVTMPALDGWEVLERVRGRTDVPVLMLTGRGTELEKVRALRAGADDYVTKPFSHAEMVARVEMLLRRPRGEADREVLEDGFVEIDFGTAEARVRGEPLVLSALEMRLLAAFVAHPRQVLSAGQLLALAWRAPDLPPDRVKTYVSYLRDKLRAVGIAEPPIQTVRGFGYRYDPPVGPEPGGSPGA